MSIFDRLKGRHTKLDFTDIDTKAKAQELAKEGLLVPLYLMPIRFNGEESLHNKLYVPKVIVKRKDKCDDKVEQLLIEGKVNNYVCTPEYKGQSFIPSKLTIEAKMNGKLVYTETIDIW